MKKTYRFITTCAVCCAVCAATVAITSCSFEQEDYFDENASLRVTHLNESLQDRLVAQSDTTQQKYGWLIQYFVAGTDEANYEGFNIFARFYKSGKVTMASNHRYLRNGQANKYTEHDSFYEMLAEEGPVLSFNTWNDILTVLVDPVSPGSAPTSIVADGEGMNGDHNLVLTKYDENSITFRGERHGAEVRFIPCDRPWKEYMEAVEKTKSDITSSYINSYYVTNNFDKEERDTMYFVGLSRGYFSYCDRIVDPLVNLDLSCVFTPKGFRLGSVFHLEESIFREFTIDADSTCLISENDSIRVIPCWDNYIINNRNTVWNFDVNQMNEQQQQLFEQLGQEFKKANKNYTLAQVGLGRSSGSGAVRGLVFTFYTNAAKSKTNTAGLALTTVRPAFGQMRIECSDEDKADKNLTTIAAKTEAEQLARQLAQSLAGTYDIIPDSHFHPTSCTLKAVNGTAELTIK
ncbi:MAG: DUF4302 domain-containing protein [Prevotella sp.]|nr:DUF4302 domain-containing protein [Prevotella sp.]